MSGMTVEQALAARREAEAKISQILLELVRNSGLGIGDVHCRQNACISMGKEYVTNVDVQIVLMLPRPPAPRWEPM